MAENPNEQPDWMAAYQARLLDLFRNPLGGGEPPPDALRGWSRNRTCGDEVEFHIVADGSQVQRLWQQTNGCAIATATASLLVRELQGMEPERVRMILHSISTMVKTGESTAVPGELELLRAVHTLPARHDCVGVALRACEEALQALDANT